MISPTASRLLRPDSRQPVPRSPLGDYYRALLRNLTSAPPFSENPPRLVGVTSSTRGEGVSTVTVNLARHAAIDLNQHTLVIDLSPTQQSAARILGDSGGPGLSDMLLRRVEPSECLRKSPLGNVAVLGLGSLGEELKASLERERVAKAFAALKAAYPLTVVDLPVATALSGCFSVAGLLDGILLVVQAEGVRSQVARYAKEQLTKADGKLLGVVFNKRPQHVPDWIYRRL